MQSSSGDGLPEIRLAKCLEMSEALEKSSKLQEASEWLCQAVKILYTELDQQSQAKKLILRAKAFSPDSAEVQRLIALCFNEAVDGTKMLHRPIVVTGRYLSRKGPDDDAASPAAPKVTPPSGGMAESWGSKAED